MIVYARKRTVSAFIRAEPKRINQWRKKRKTAKFERTNKMDMPTSALTGLTLKDLFDAGLHFGHQTKRWNPKMKSYIFDKRNGIHIIDLTQTVTMLDEAAEFLKNVILSGKKVLFVATKKQAQEIVREAADGAKQFSVTERWLGGTLTNNQTIRGSIKRMKQLQVIGNKNGGVLSVHKQENSVLRRELAKLEKNLTGIAEMTEQPGAVFIVDVIREANAVKEAVRLGIPVVAITDTNADPDPIDYVIPGNDDSVRGIEMIVTKLAEVIKNADAEYSAKAAEERKQRDEENKKRESEQKAARAARKEVAKKGDKPARKPAKTAGGVDIKVKKAAKEAKEAAEAKAKAAQQAIAAEAPAEVKAEEAPAAE